MSVAYNPHRSYTQLPSVRIFTLRRPRVGYRWCVCPLSSEGLRLRSRSTTYLFGTLYSESLHFHRFTGKKKKKQKQYLPNGVFGKIKWDDKLKHKHNTWHIVKCSVNILFFKNIASPCSHTNAEDPVCSWENAWCCCQSVPPRLSRSH